MNKAMYRVSSLVVPILVASQARASWLSDLTGIDINVPAGTIRVGQPQPLRAIQQLPQALRNLPSDVASSLNPAAAAMAYAIRNGKAQASYGARPIPADVSSVLQAYFPPDVMLSVRYNTMDTRRITIDSAALGAFDQGAITLEDVVVFQSEALAHDWYLWAHELTHVLQYRQMGVERFSNIYTLTFGSELERQARDAASSIKSWVDSRGGLSAGPATPQRAYFSISGSLYYCDPQGNLYSADQNTGRVISGIELSLRQNIIAAAS